MGSSIIGVLYVIWDVGEKVVVFNFVLEIGVDVKKDGNLVIVGLKVNSIIKDLFGRLFNVGNVFGVVSVVDVIVLIIFVVDVIFSNNVIIVVVKLSENINVINLFLDVIKV